VNGDAVSGFPMMPESAAPLAAALAGRYTIERELGRGGMATVYLARDLRHDRPVALKVLHPELAATLGPERFLREIKLAARLQHPHILTVLDSGESAGRLWFTMPFVEGESLRDRLSREKQLPMADALRIAREAATALDYAHRHDTIHRDIKPENLLLTSDGQVLVADFGIGRALSGAMGSGNGPAESRLTETGMVVGTAAYMSPEQASGQREVDGRTDVYSLGVVLYETLVGETPFTGPTAQAIIAKRFSGEVPSIRKTRPSVPESVERVVTQALAMVPADRFATAGDFGKALEAESRAAGQPGSDTRATAGRLPARPPTRLARPLTAALAIGFLLGLGVLFGWLRSHGSVAETGSKTTKLLAVLPFENLGDSTDEYFADGITDEVRGKLATLPGLQVIASGSAEQYKHSTKSPQQIAQELGVQYLLIGKIRWEKGSGAQSRVRVSPELVQVSSGSAPTTKWQQPFDASLTDVFQVQADIAGRVAQALNVALGTSVQQQLAEQPTADLAAYDAYLKGVEFYGLDNTPASLRSALSHFEQAVALDTSFAPAWARLSQAASLLYGQTVPSRQLAAQSRAAAQRALALAPNRPEGHVAMGDYLRRIDLDHARALEEYVRGRRLTPSDAELLRGSGMAERGLGRWEAALEHLQQAQTLDPRSATIATDLTTILVALRRYPEALDAADRALALVPGSLINFEWKVAAHLGEGNLAAARALLRSAPATMEPAALVAYIATYYDLFWALDDEQQALVLRLGPGQFDNDRGAWGLALAGTHAHRGDQTRARAYADSARIAMEEQLRDAPDDPGLHIYLGTALAYLGHKADAVALGKRGVELLPISRDAVNGPYFQHQLARIYILVGEPDKALDRLEPLLKIPYYLSPAWLRIDPTFDPLRKHPRFQKLVAER
jgi:eukaryotic-like serine/threonine-protein kinase